MTDRSGVSRVWNRFSSISLGTFLFAGGIILLVGTFTVSAALAPSVDRTTELDYQSHTLVGS